MTLLTNELYFPPVEQADEDGLLAIGGDLSTKRLQLAYSKGIFPWFSEGEPICWYSPNPRFVLLPHMLKISKSMQQIIRKQTFQFTINKDFENVIANCKAANRVGQDGTWITDEMEAAYTALHSQGLAISAETWLDNELVGGLYGVLQGRVFCGESMFAKQSNASKFAFINMVNYLQTKGVLLIDCQVYTEHLESLGAVFVSREDYLSFL